jgi:hypothetical protein
MEIIRLENGNVELRDGGVFLWSMPQLPTEIRPIDKETRDHVKLFQNDGRVEYLYVDEITETQVLPDAAVPFSGSVADLASLMSSDFFFEVVSGGGGFSESVIFQEQDTNTATTNAIWATRHTFSGELDAGIYQIDSYLQLEILNLSGSLRNGIRIDSVITADQIKGQTFLLNQANQILNRFIYSHSGGTVLIESQFRRFTAATLAQCLFSNLIIKRIG